MPPTSQPAASSAAAATAHSRRRSGAVGVLPSRPARASGSSTRAAAAATRVRSTAASASHAPATPAPAAPAASNAAWLIAARSAGGSRARDRGASFDGGDAPAGGATAGGRRRTGRQRVVGARSRAARRPASVSPSGARQAGRPARTVNSSRTAGPPATRTTSPTSTIRRTPSAPRSWRTTRSIASAIWSRIAASGSPTSAISASVSSRRSASAPLPAWIVQSEPACPVLSATSRSSASGPRTSPTISRSGRIRSALRTSRRIVTSPRPSRFGGRASSRTTCGSAQPQLGGVLDRHDALGGIDERGERAERRRLPRPGAAADQQRAARRDRAAEELEQRPRERPVGEQVRRREPARAEAPDRQQRTVERERRQHDVHARAIGQPGVAQRLGLVGAAPERRQDPLDRVAQLGLAAEPHVGLREAPAALDPHRLGPADEQLVDRRVAQQRLQRPEPDRPLGHPRGERLARRGVEHARLALDERADPRGGVVAGARLAGAVDQPVAQRPGEAVEGIGRGLHHDRVGRHAPISPPGSGVSAR